MKKLALPSLGLVLLTLVTFAAVQADHHGDDVAAVKQAVLDYVEGVYDVAPDRIRRGVHPELAKRGFARRSDDQPYRELKMTFDQLVELSAGYNKDGHVAADAPKEVIVYEVLDQTASVKLIAEWGIDYMHLAKYDGKWQIVNVMWQTQ